MSVIIETEPTRPNLEDRPRYRRTCPECGCQFTYQFEDTVMNNYIGGLISIKCPYCAYPVAHVVGGSGDDLNNPEGQV